ncbi:DUF3159 domain-containing protein [Frankia sp. Mgl5]|uniref:DUF3159 domain-containing protein n=1 Tax=Frankia sp. Mgl5 TaxID=2933793 RepID=UPI00200C7116|nr:DUF3159 domain-containing protein [Frankia sp. Mgl5]MCK9928195.1 DUF3159 domain-containing protein [Frankia sp. Mgl5]
MTPVDGVAVPGAGPGLPAGRDAAASRAGGIASRFGGRSGGSGGSGGRGTAGESPVTLAEAVGGPRGIIDSAIPTVAFVTVNAEAGLTAGIVVAIAAAVGLVVLRVVRHEPVQQAFSGLFAVGFAAFIASRTGSAEGFFLPSIAKNAVCAVVGLGSVLVGRPVGGYVMAGFDQRYSDWRETPSVRRAAVWATFVWIAVFAARFAIQGVLYLAGESGWLAAANIVLGLPLFGTAVLATFAIVRRLAPLAEDEPSEEDGQTGEPGQLATGIPND